MRNLFVILILTIVGMLAATSLVIKREDQSRVIVPIDTIDSLYFSDAAAGDVAQLNFIDSEEDLWPTAPIQIELLDPYGGLVPVSMPVELSFDSIPPEGASINNLIYYAGETITVYSESGVVNATLDWGFASGTATVRATVLRGDETITQTHAYQFHNTIPIHISVFPTAEGFLGENGFWVFPIGAQISNYWGEPLSFDSPFNFAIANSDMDWCSIEPVGYTGNSTPYTDPIEGVAQTIITYDSSHEFQTLFLVISVDDFQNTCYLDLSLSQPTLRLLSNPMHLDWGDENQTDPQVSHIRATVEDSSGNPIPNAVIVLTSTHGTFIEPEEQYQVPGQGWNYIQTNENGLAIASIEFHQYECPPVDPPPNEVQVDITGSVQGADVTDQTTIILLNYNEPE